MGCRGKKINKKKIAFYWIWRCCIFRYTLYVVDKKGEHPIVEQNITIYVNDYPRDWVGVFETKQVVT